MSSYNLTHLKALESEAVFILREVVQCFDTENENIRPSTE